MLSSIEYGDTKRVHLYIDISNRTPQCQSGVAMQHITVCKHYVIHINTAIRDDLLLDTLRRGLQLKREMGDEGVECVR